MKKVSVLLTGIIFLFSIAGAYAQTADEIVKNYFNNTGGYDAWGEVEGMKMETIIKNQGMEIPLTIIQLADGRQMTVINLQGNELKQGVFDGETVWGINMQSMKPEKMNTETTENMKLDKNDFPDPLYEWEAKGYSLEKVGSETVEGTETIKLKLTKEPKTIDGEEVPDVLYYYFDTEAFIPILTETEIKQGPQKGSIQQVKMSDYQEVDGFYLPFSIEQGLKGGATQTINIDTITLNPDVDDSEFAFPGDSDQ